MIIHIANTTTVAQVRDALTAKFPFLKIEFFRKSHGEGEMSKIKDQLPPETVLNEFRNSTAPGDLVLTSTMRVSEVENAFEEHFGLSAQIFRKQGGAWIMTGITDTWTLEQQNREGQELSVPVED